MCHIEFSLVEVKSSFIRFMVRLNPFQYPVVINNRYSCIFVLGNFEYRHCTTPPNKTDIKMEAKNGRQYLLHKIGYKKKRTKNSTTNSIKL